MPERHDPAVLFKALDDPTRRKLLDLLHAHDGRTLNNLCEHLEITRQSVAQHLDVLEEANIDSGFTAKANGSQERLGRCFFRTAALPMQARLFESDAPKRLMIR